MPVAPRSRGPAASTAARRGGKVGGGWAQQRQNDILHTKYTGGAVHDADLFNRALHI